MSNVAASNLVSSNGTIVHTTAPMFGKVTLSAGSMAVYDRFGRSVKAASAVVPLAHTGLTVAIDIYGRLDDKTSKVKFSPSIPRGFSGETSAKDRLKAHIVSAIKGWNEWPSVARTAEHAARTGKVKAVTKNADGTETELETELDAPAIEAAPVAAIEPTEIESAPEPVLAGSGKAKGAK